MNAVRSPLPAGFAPSSVGDVTRRSSGGRSHTRRDQLGAPARVAQKPLLELAEPDPVRVVTRVRAVDEVEGAAFVHVRHGVAVVPALGHARPMPAVRGGTMSLLINAAWTCACAAAGPAPARRLGRIAVTQRNRAYHSVPDPSRAVRRHTACTTSPAATTMCCPVRPGRPDRPAGRRSGCRPTRSAPRSGRLREASRQRSRAAPPMRCRSPAAEVDRMPMFQGVPMFSNTYLADAVFIGLWPDRFDESRGCRREDSTR